MQHFSSARDVFAPPLVPNYFRWLQSPLPVCVSYLIQLFTMPYNTIIMLAELAHTLLEENCFNSAPLDYLITGFNHTHLGICYSTYGLVADGVRPRVSKSVLMHSDVNLHLKLNSVKKFPLDTMWALLYNKVRTDNGTYTRTHIHTNTRTFSHTWTHIFSLSLSLSLSLSHTHTHTTNPQYRHLQPWLCESNSRLKWPHHLLFSEPAG